GESLVGQTVPVPAVPGGGSRGIPTGSDRYLRPDLPRSVGDRGVAELEAGDERSGGRGRRPRVRSARSHHGHSGVLLWRGGRRGISTAPARGSTARRARIVHRSEPDVPAGRPRGEEFPRSVPRPAGTSLARQGALLPRVLPLPSWVHAAGLARMSD